jgi:hypothetical protein
LGRRIGKSHPRSQAHHLLKELFSEFVFVHN